MYIWFFFITFVLSYLIKNLSNGIEPYSSSLFL